MSVLEEQTIDLSPAFPMSLADASRSRSVDTPLVSQLVVLVHGLGAPKLAMSALRRRLDKIGYQTLNWGYPSTRDRIETHADRLAETLHAVSEDQSLSNIHLVTHSMGGILTRAALLKHSFRKLHRIVMLAPPNRGSHVARFVAPVFGWLCAPLSELSDAPNSFVNRLPDFRSFDEIELGIIEAKRDNVVASESVRLEGQVDHALVDSRHGTLPWHPQAFQLVSHFLRDGKFGAES